jgi:hypothetical protein
MHVLPGVRRLNGARIRVIGTLQDVPDDARTPTLMFKVQKTMPELIDFANQNPASSRRHVMVSPSI